MICHVWKDFLLTFVPNLIMIWSEMILRRPRGIYKE